MKGTSKERPILVCDDDKAIARLLQVQLERSGYRVETCHDGFEGLQRVQTDQYGLLILDLMMPVLDGFEVLRKLKCDPSTSNTPVIVLTAKDQDEDVYKAYRYGADLFLTKPVEADELCGFVRGMLN